MSRTKSFTFPKQNVKQINYPLTKPNVDISTQKHFHTSIVAFERYRGLDETFKL